MITQAQLTPGTKYSLQLYGINENENTYSGVVLGISAASILPTAVSTNAVITHNNIWGSLPVETQNAIDNNYASYMYVILELEDTKELRYIGLPWIKDGSLVEITDEVTTIILSSLTTEDKVKLQPLLERNNLKVLSIVHE